MNNRELRVRLNFNHPVKEISWNYLEPKFERKYNNFTIHKNKSNDKKFKNIKFYKSLIHSSKFFKLNQFDWSIF